MKKCKFCMQEIDSKSKICPYCQKKQKKGGKIVVIAIIALVVVLGGIGGANSTKPTSGKNDSSQSDSVESSQTEKTTYGVGEYAENNGIRVSLIGVTENQGSEYNKPADGKVFVFAEFEIENNSDKDLTISSVLSFEAYIDGYSTSQSLSALIEKGDKTQLDGSVAKGKKMKGVIGYEVPVDWKELEITVTPSFWSASSDVTFVANH